jgi:hypothetical protein
MRRLRSPSHSRVLWIDAICINQNDDDEKSHQVGMMRKIYKACQKCTVWLGEGPEGPQPDARSASAIKASELLQMLGTGKHLPELPCFLMAEGGYRQLRRSMRSISEPGWRYWTSRGGDEFGWFKSWLCLARSSSFTHSSGFLIR